MELKEAIEKRRSIRKYKETEVSDEILMSIIKQATLAPSGHNRQPWKFQIIKGATKDIIADTLIQKTKDIEGATAPYTANLIKAAPAIVAIYYDGYEESHYVNDLLSIGGAIENMLLAITDMDLGGLWIGDILHIKEELKEIVGDVNLISMVAVGYKDQDPHARPRKPLEELIMPSFD